MVARGRVLMVVLAVAFAWALASAAAASADVFHVTTTADLVDANPGDGVCDAGQDQGCSLRAAIQEANADGNGADTIVFDQPGSQTFHLTLGDGGSESGSDPASSGDLDITEALTIIGNGQGNTIIDASGLGDRAFDVFANVTASISGVTITGGHANDVDVVDNGDLTVGGGVRDLGQLTLTDATLSGNTAPLGGGAGTDLDSHTKSLAPAMTLLRVLVTDNGTPGRTQGGGVAEVGGDLNIESSTIRNNQGVFGVGVDEDGGGTVELVDSLVDGNVATPTPDQAASARSTPRASDNTEAGGIVETGGGAVTLTRTEVTRNRSGFGGGIVEDGGGSVDIFDSWIHANSAGPGDDGDGAGVLEDGGGSLQIIRTTIDSNTAEGSGGGIDEIGGGHFQIVNSTITGNSARVDGGALEMGGGGTVNVEESTLHDDTATRNGNEIDTCVERQGACTTGNGTVNLHDTIVASTGACSQPVVSLGHNLGGDSTCGLGAVGDLVNVDPLLAALASNGGPTRTEAELPGSPAIDHGECAGRGASTTPPFLAFPGTDQRGVARPQGASCDIGAFETAPALAPAPIAVAQPSVTIGSHKARRCVSRRHFRIRIRKRHGLKIVEAVVRVNGHRVRVLRGKRLRASIDLRHLPKGTFHVRITVTLKSGRRLSATRTYHTCARKRKGGVPKL